MADELRIERPGDALFAAEGGLYSCDLDDVVEYGAKAPWPASTVFHGIITEDGVEESTDTSITKHRGWQGSRVYRQTTDSSDTTVAASLVEYSRPENQKLFIGSNINPVTGGRHFDPSQLGEHRQFFIQAEDKDNNLVSRIWYPDGQLFERSSRVFKKTEGTKLGITLTMFDTVVEGERTTSVEWIEPLNSSVGS